MKRTILAAMLACVILLPLACKKSSSPTAPAGGQPGPSATDTSTFTSTPTGTYYTETFTSTPTPTDTSAPPTWDITCINAQGTVEPCPFTATFTSTPTGTWVPPTHTITNTLCFVSTDTPCGPSTPMPPADTSTPTQTLTGTAIPLTDTPTVTLTGTIIPSTDTDTPVPPTATETLTGTLAPPVDTYTPTATLTPALTGTVCIFGWSTPGTINDSLGENPQAALAMKFDLPTGGTANSLGLYIPYAGNNARVGIYSDDGTGSSPSTLIVESAAVPAGAGWNLIDIPDTPLTAGTYWLALQVENGSLSYSADGGRQYAFILQTFGSFPAVVTGWTYLSDYVASIFVNLCEVPTYTPTISYTPTPTPTGTYYTETYTNTPTVTLTPTITMTGIPVCGFGNDSLPPDTSGYPLDNIYGTRFFLAADGTVNSISVYMPEYDLSNIMAAVYADDGGGTVPGSFIVGSASQPSHNGWNTLDIVDTFLAAGNYWLVFEAENRHIHWSIPSGSEAFTYGVVTYGSFPADGSGLTADTGVVFHIYANLCSPIPTSTPVDTATPTQTPTGTLTPPADTDTPTETLTSTIIPSTDTDTPVPPTATLTPTITGTICAFGWQAIGTINEGAGGESGHTWTMRTMPALSGTAGSVSLYIPDGGGNLRAAIFSDSTGIPGSLLAESLVVPAMAGWNRIDIPDTPITGGEYYWLAFQIENGSLSYTYSGSELYADYAQTFGPFPTSGWGVASGVLFPIFANLCDPQTPSPTPTVTETPSATNSPTETPTGTFTGTVVLFTDDFSTDTGWTYGTEWERGYATASTGHNNMGCGDPDTDTSPTGDNVVAGAVIGGNVTTSLHDFYWFTSPSVDASSVPGLYLRFNRWLNSDYLPYMQSLVEVWDGGEWVTLYYSADGPGVTDCAWQPMLYDLTPYMNADLRVRFGHMVDDPDVYTVSGWNIDDVWIGWDSGIVPPTPTPSPSTPIPTATVTAVGICPDNSWSGWTMDGLWHVVNNPFPCVSAYSGTQALYYGQDSTCDYDTGTVNSGNAFSPSVLVPAGGTLSFMSWEQTEGDSDYDWRTVYISTNGGADWTPLRECDDESATWYQVDVDLSSYAGATAQFRFEFDTVDDGVNGYPGWYIDNVCVH